MQGDGHIYSHTHSQIFRPLFRDKLSLLRSLVKAAAATVTETATMTATTTIMKTKATASLTAARRRRWQRAGGGESAAEAGSTINIFQTGIVCCLIECFILEEPISIVYPAHTELMCLSVLYGCVSVALILLIDTTAPQMQT